MDALIPDKESRYYLKLFALTLGIGMEVLHQYFEQKILNTMDFYLFLEQYKHCLFHECYPAVQCCECCQLSLDAHPKRGCLSEIQYHILFDIAPPTNHDHYKIGRNNTVIMDCLCRIDAKRSIEVDCMDITLMCAIIKTCFLNKKISIHGNPQALETIKKTRNFLAHSCLRISKSEFEDRLAETEIAIVEIASTVGKYFKKLQQRRIEELKNNELTMETLKRIIESNADEIKKNLQTFIDEQRKTIMLNKDEIIEHLIKYKGKLEELSINIGELRFEVKQYAVSMSDSSTSEEMSNTDEVSKMEATSCSSEAHTMEKNELNIQSSVPDTNTTACSSKTHTTEKDMHCKKCRVEWRLETPNTWNLAQIKESLEKFSDLLRQWFEIEFVYVGSLVLKTLVTANVLHDRDKMRKSIHSFLEKVVEVCNINTDVYTVIRVALLVSVEADENESEAVIKCENCKKKDDVISGLTDKIYEMSKTVSAVSLNSDLSEKKDDTKEAQAAIVLFREPLKDKTCFEGETISLECVIQGPKTTSKWCKGDNGVLPDNVRDDSKDQLHKLTFLQATRENSGEYTFSIGGDKRNVHLNVIERQPCLIELRNYQQELAEIALRGENTMICAGTNAGKTYVAFHVIESHLLKNPSGKVVFISKTHVLSRHQYERAIDTFTTPNFQGKIKIWGAYEEDSDDFEKEIEKASLIFMTPKSLCNHLNDTAAVKVSIEKFTLLILDECHTAHDKSVYSELMSFFRIAKFRENLHQLPQILGLTASPGTNKAKDIASAKNHLMKVMANLDVSVLSVVKRNKEELLQYISIPEEVLISTTRKQDSLTDILFDAMDYVEHTLNSPIVSNFLTENLHNNMDLCEALSNLPKQRMDLRYIQWIAETKEKVEHVLHKDPKVPRLLHACLRHLELYAACLEINKLLEIEQVCDVICQGYADEFFSSHVANTDEEMQIVFKLQGVLADIREIGQYIEGNPDSLAVVERIESEYKKLKQESRFIIFVKTRATARALSMRLPDYLRSNYLTGSNKYVEEGGRLRDKQIDVLEKFRRGDHLCIVATSEGCEGLDIPQCNMMIRYRFSADEISSLQMRGMVRKREGREVIVCTTKEFETEIKNIQRQYLITLAIEEVSKLDIARDIAIAEKNIYEMEEIERRAEKNKLSLKRKGLFSVLCKYCGVFITDGERMRHVNEKMFFVCDKTMLARVDQRPIAKKKQKEFDGFKRQGKAYGIECRHNWGSIITYKECEFVALSQDYVQIFDSQTGEFIYCKKWCDLKFKIEAMSNDDLMSYNTQLA